jgi:peptide/nickel transport system permease protein
VYSHALVKGDGGGRMLFFRKVVLRRVAHFLWVYVVLIYIFSALFSAQIQLRELQTLEYDLRGSTSDRRGPGGMTLEQYDEFIRGRLAAISRERGYDKPFLLRVHALSLRVLRFDFGTTLLANPIYFPSGKNAMSIVAEYAIPTVILFGSAFLIQMLLGVLLGLYNASRPGRWLDKGTTLLATVSSATPPAVAAMFVVLFLLFILPTAPRSAWMFWLPRHWSELGPWASTLFSHVAAPLATVVLLSVWQTAHMVRSITVQTLHEDFISAARARGLPERKVLYGHGLRTAAPPIATMLTVGMTSVLWGSFLVEPIFQWRGLGMLFMRAILANEINLLMALLVVCTLATQLGLVTLDLVYSWLDPRIRTAGSL